jgi:polynucleotide 5'-hydroxyl-kinase GRC3/NOL9
MGKALPFELAGRGRLRVLLLRGGRMWSADSSEAGVSMWHEVASQVSGMRTVMIAGDSDTGKSTLAVYLANMAISRGLVPCVVDGDIGQGDLGPPGGIGAATLSRPVTDLRDAVPAMFEFVGDTSPAGMENLVAKKLKTVLDRARPLGDVCIVNTDGYASGAGAQYKLILAKELQPDAIVCLGENPELLEALAGGPWQLLRARASSQAWKSRSERTRRRLGQFLRHVGGGSVTADLRQIRFVYAGLLFLQSELDSPPIRQLERENMKRMFVGLGSGGTVTGFGIIKNAAGGTIRLRTGVRDFDTVYLGNIRLEKGIEVRL